MSWILVPIGCPIGIQFMSQLSRNPSRAIIVAYNPSLEVHKPKFLGAHHMRDYDTEECSEVLKIVKAKNQTNGVREVIENWMPTYASQRRWGWGLRPRYIGNFVHL